MEPLHNERVHATVNEALSAERGLGITANWHFSGLFWHDGIRCLVILDYDNGPPHEDREQWSSGLQDCVKERTGLDTYVVWKD